MARHRLGDVAYFDHDDGAVTRTIVSEIGLDDQVGYLEHSHRKPHLTFESAQAAALATLRTKEQALASELEQVRARIDLVGATSYRAQVDAAPLKNISGSMIGAAFKLDGEVADISIPESYFDPGLVVYCVITPDTHNMFTPHYRPYQYFVLESQVKETQLALNGKALYRIDSYYNPRSDAIFANLDDAKQALLKTFAEKTGGTLPFEKVAFVSWAEEKEKNRQSSERISQQVKRQFAKLSGED